MRCVSIEQSGGDFLLRPAGKGDPFRSRDVIYFRNSLWAEHDSDTNSFTFRRQKLGRQGIRYLFSYLGAEGFTLKLDVGASRALAEIKGGQEVLDQSRRAGLELKQQKKKTLNISGFKRGLKPFQIPATAHMIKVSHPANFSVPGSGKTTITLAAFADLNHAKTVDVLVVVVPRSSFAPWETETKI